MNRLDAKPWEVLDISYLGDLKGVRYEEYYLHVEIWVLLSQKYCICPYLIDDAKCLWKIISGMDYACHK